MGEEGELAVKRLRNADAVLEKVLEIPSTVSAVSPTGDLRSLGKEGVVGVIGAEDLTVSTYIAATTVMTSSFLFLLQYVAGSNWQRQTSLSKKEYIQNL